MAQFPTRTRAQIRRSIASLMHREKFVWGSVLASPAPTTTTFALNEAKRFPNDYLQGRNLYVVDGTQIGQSAVVSGSAVGTGVVTYAPATTLAIPAVSTVEIYPEDLYPDSINEAINIAILDVAEFVHVPYETTNPTLDSDRQFLTLPGDFTKVTDVRYLDDGDVRHVYQIVDEPHEMWDHNDAAFLSGSQLQLRPWIPASIAGASIILRGYRHPVLMTTDSDICEVNPAYLIFRAAGLLEQARVEGAGLDPEQHQVRANNWLAQALVLREALTISWRPGTREVEV